MKSSVLLALPVIASIALAQQPGDAARLTGANDRINPAVQPKPLNDKGEESEAEISLDDLNDIGPLQVLDLTPRFRWFEAGAGVQAFYTDNVALLEQKTHGDVSVLSAHAGINSKPVSTEFGDFAFHADYDYSAFFYGVLSGRSDTALAGSVRNMDALDFQSHAGTLEAEWRRGGWSAGTGVRGAVYYDTHQGDREYGETVPYLRVGYTFELSREDYLTVEQDTDYRFTNTPLPAGFADILGTKLNDRYDLGLTVAYLRLIGANWFLQPAYRVAFSQYTQGGSTPGDAGAGAQCVTQTVLLSLGYAPNSWLLARVFTSFEARDGDEASMPDYRVGNIGLGASVTAKF